VSNLNQELDTKSDGKPHKLALKHINGTIKTQVDGDAETLDSLNLEVIQTYLTLFVDFRNYLF
jgi:hypothetical protein